MNDIECINETALKYIKNIRFIPLKVVISYIRYLCLTIALVNLYGKFRCSYDECKSRQLCLTKISMGYHATNGTANLTVRQHLLVCSVTHELPTSASGVEPAALPDSS